VELDLPDNDGVTAMQSACAQGRFDVINMLLDAGASCAVRTKTGETALISGTLANFQDVVRPGGIAQTNSATPYTRIYCVFER
jgi:ankyrin repeat protein